MQENINNKLNQLNASPFMQQTKCLALTFCSAYLLLTNPDVVITVLGVFFGVVALANLVKTAYKANTTSVKKNKKATK
jgi:hypothetical protein